MIHFLGRFTHSAAAAVARSKCCGHDGIGMCLLIKRLERGQFIWPMSSAGIVSLTPGQLSTLLEGCEWRAAARNLRPELAG